MEENILNTVESIYGKPTANVTLSGERQKASPEIRNKTMTSVLPLLLNTVL
jgi:hypothetical protein